MCCQISSKKRGVKLLQGHFNLSKNDPGWRPKKMRRKLPCERWNEGTSVGEWQERASRWTGVRTELRESLGSIARQSRRGPPGRDSDAQDFPPESVARMQGVLGRRVTLRDVDKNLWTVEVERGGINGFYFDKGWPQFYHENHLELGDIVAFEYKHDNLFDFKLFGCDACEKKGVCCPNFRVKEGADEVEEFNDEEEEDEDDEENSDDDDEDYVVEKLESEKEEIVCMSKKSSKSNKDISSIHASSKKRVKEEEIEIEDESDEYDEIDMLKHKSNKGLSSIHASPKKRVKEEEIEIEDGEDEYEGIEKLMKESKSRSSSSSSLRHKKHDINDYYGHDIFRSGLAIRPKNPYFVSRSRNSRKNELYIPNEVIGGWNLKIPARMLVVDGSGRKWESRIKKWKDGRLWCTGGWKRMCSANNIGAHDTCICEFVQRRSHALYMLVRLVHAAAAATAK